MVILTSWFRNTYWKSKQGKTVTDTIELQDLRDSETTLLIFLISKVGEIEAQSD